MYRMRYKSTFDRTNENSLERLKQEPFCHCNMYCYTEATMANSDPDDTGYKKTSCYKFIKSNIITILYQFQFEPKSQSSFCVTKIMCLTENGEKSWRRSPMEFISHSVFNGLKCARLLENKRLLYNKKLMRMFYNKCNTERTASTQKRIGHTS